MPYSSSSFIFVTFLSFQNWKRAKIQTTTYQCFEVLYLFTLAGNCYFSRKKYLTLRNFLDDVNIWMYISCTTVIPIFKLLTVLVNPEWGRHAVSPSPTHPNLRLGWCTSRDLFKKICIPTKDDFQAFLLRDQDLLNIEPWLLLHIGSHSVLE